MIYRFLINHEKHLKDRQDFFRRPKNTWQWTDSLFPDNIPAKNEVNNEEKTNESMIGKIKHLQKRVYLLWKYRRWTRNHERQHHNYNISNIIIIILAPWTAPSGTAPLHYGLSNGNRDLLLIFYHNLKIPVVTGKQLFKYWRKHKQELRMLSSVTINCQVTKIVMNSGSHLSEL